MTKPIRQTVTLPASAASLYRMYLSAKTHAAITGGKVVVSARRGSKFSAFGGLLWGRTLYTVPGCLIVQAWRSTNFRKSDVDSTLILRFIPAGAKARIELTHVGVPPQDHRGVTNGWKKYYWRPWRLYLRRR
jgi:activator of HSP90 ATPase